MAVTYEITVEGQLDERWLNWFEGMTMRHVEIGPGETILAGEMRDQARLHGVLIKIRDLGLTLVSVQRIEIKNETGLPGARPGGS